MNTTRIALIKRTLCLLGLPLLIAAAGFGCGKNGVRYRTEAVVRGDVTEAVTATGTVNPVTTVLIGTQVSGTIKDIYVDFNSPVKQGQTIARIDPELFEAQVAQARAGVQKAEAQARDAGRSLGRTRDLFARNLIARSELDAAETAAESAAAQLSQAAAALRVAETNLRYTHILSPVDGIVISRSVDVGQTVAASFQTPTLFTIARDLTKMRINAGVDEADIGKVKARQTVEFTVDAFPDETFSGAVEQVRNAPTTVQNVVTYDVVVTVNNRALKLKPGMTANVSIITARKTGVLTVPNAALRFRPERSAAPAGNNDRAGNAGPAVWILEKDAPKRIDIKPGISDGMVTEILSGDLRESQQVIVETVGANKPAPPPGPRMF